jgi:hypothetical protein
MTIVHQSNSQTSEEPNHAWQRGKYIDVRFHFLRDLIKKGNIQLVHCTSHDQLADIMTKSLKS